MLIIAKYTENRPDLRSTLLSPARNQLPEGYTFEGFPRTLMCYGDAEMFKASNVAFAGLLPDVKLVAGVDKTHVYSYLVDDLTKDEFYQTIKPFLKS